VLCSGSEGGISRFEIHTRGNHDAREAISQKVVSNGWPLRRLDLRLSTLEERFAQAVTEDSRALPEREAV
jgi:hypothetical protein